MGERLVAYNFMAKFFGSLTIDSADQLEAAISNRTADPRCIPSFWYCDYDIDAKRRINSLWSMRYGFENIKVKDGVVVDHYRLVNRADKLFVSLDLITKEEIEFYRNDPVTNRLNKHSTTTGEVLSWTKSDTYDSLPSEFKLALTDFPQKENIRYWAIKDYGRIVGLAKAPTT